MGVSEPEEPEEESSRDETESDAPKSRIPEDAPGDYETKQFMWTSPGLPPPLVVTVSDGFVTRRYAPTLLIARLAEKIGTLLKDLGGGFEPMFYGAIAGNSMQLAFGDPEIAAAQGTLPVEVVQAQAQRVAELIELEDEELFARAIVIGRPMTQYAELANVVQSTGVTLKWSVRGDRARVLQPGRAGRQHTMLSEPAQTQDRPITVNGTLYRVITEETRKGYKGSVGIHLHSWSADPPYDHRRQRIIAFYEAADVEEAIKGRGLIGEPVEAKLLIRQPVPGASIEPDRFDLVVRAIDAGPTEDSRFGVRLRYRDDEGEDVPTYIGSGEPDWYGEPLLGAEEPPEEQDEDNTVTEEVEGQKAGIDEDEDEDHS